MSPLKISSDTPVCADCIRVVISGFMQNMNIIQSFLLSEHQFPSAFKVLAITYKALHGFKPLYLQDCLSTCLPKAILLI